MNNLQRVLRGKTRVINSKRWGFAFVALGPLGEQSTDHTTGTELKSLQNISNTIKVDPESGEDIIVRNPQLTFSIDSMNPIPKAGEDWMFKIPTGSDSDEPSVWYKMSKDHVYQNDELGVITVHLIKIVQKPEPIV